MGLSSPRSTGLPPRFLTSSHGQYPGLWSLQTGFSQSLSAERIAPGNGIMARCRHAADPALFQHGNPRFLVDLCQIMCRCQAMATAANDNIVILGLWLGIAPDGLPSGLTPQSFYQQFECGVTQTWLLSRLPEQSHIAVYLIVLTGS